MTVTEAKKTGMTVEDFRMVFSKALVENKIFELTDEIKFSEAIQHGFNHLDVSHTYDNQPLNDALQQSFLTAVESTVRNCLESENIVSAEDIKDKSSSFNESTIIYTEDKRTGILSLHYRLEVADKRFNVYTHLSGNMYFDDVRLAKTIQNIELQIKDQLLVLNKKLTVCMDYTIDEPIELYVTWDENLKTNKLSYEVMLWDEEECHYDTELGLAYGEGGAEYGTQQTEISADLNHAVLMEGLKLIADRFIDALHHKSAKLENVSSEMAGLTDDDLIKNYIDRKFFSNVKDGLIEMDELFLAKIAFQNSLPYVFHNDGEQKGFLAQEDQWVVDSTIVTEFATDYNLVVKEDENNDAFLAITPEEASIFKETFKDEIRAAAFKTVNELLIDLLLINTPNTVTHYFKTDKLEAFEFQTAEMILIDEDLESDYFRLEIRATGERSVFVASSEEFYIHEDVTGRFILDSIEEECRKQFKEGNVHDSTTDYLEFLELKDEEE